MMQFNLLPDVQLAYIRTQRIKRLVIVSSALVSSVSLFLLAIMLLFVFVLQHKALSDEAADIGKYSSQLKSINNLDTMLTVQNQLSTLTTLHENKPAVGRLFTYLSKVTPSGATLTQVQIDFTKNTLLIGGTVGSTTGSASNGSLGAVSSLTDNLKAAKYTIKGQPGSVAAFSQVVLSSFSRSSYQSSFTITANLDPNLFNAKYNVTLDIPAGSDTNGGFQGVQ